MTDMQIFVKTLAGKTTTLQCSNSNSVLDIKKMLAEKEGVAVTEQRLIYEAKQLEDHDTIASRGIPNMATLHMVMRLLGGQ